MKMVWMILLTLGALSLGCEKVEEKIEETPTETLAPEKEMTAEEHLEYIKKSKSL